MNRLRCLKKFKENYILQSEMIKLYNRYRFSIDPEVQSFNTKEKKKLIEEATIMNLLYFYFKWQGKRPASDCVPYTKKNTISRFVNTFGITLDYENINNIFDKKLYIKINYGHTLSVDNDSKKILLPKKVIYYIAKNIASNEEETISMYENFCNWIVESNICKDYLNNSKRISYE